MKDYYNLFVQLSLEQCLKDDYTDKAKVRAHNGAMDKMIKLQEEVSQIDCSDLLCTLLSHQDDRVKVNASSMCLKYNICVDVAVATLKNVMEFSDDGTLSFAAEMLLQKWNE